MVITVYISNEAQSMSPDALNSIMVITVFPSIFIFCKLFFPLNSIMVITVCAVSAGLTYAMQDFKFHYGDYCMAGHAMSSMFIQNFKFHYGDYCITYDFIIISVVPSFKFHYGDYCIHCNACRYRARLVL